MQLRLNSQKMRGTLTLCISKNNVSEENSEDAAGEVFNIHFGAASLCINCHSKGLLSHDLASQ